MKKIILFLFWAHFGMLSASLSSQLYSQGNLQFNQVKLVSTVETVPVGKVWKVESAAYNGGAPFTNSSAIYAFPGSTNQPRGFESIMSYSVNGQLNYFPVTYTIGGTSVQFSNSVNGVAHFPLWLPEGSTLAVGTNMRHLSVLEFNIIP
jgi:hypothetical protein